MSRRPAEFTLMDTLGEVESLGPSASGLLSFGDPPVGGVFVERGRICWAAATTLRTRLRDLLALRGGVCSVDLDRLYERCRAEGRLFGETLVAEGWLDAGALRSVLRRHSAESILALCRTSQPPRWAARDSTYGSQFHFAPLEILLEASALLVPDGAKGLHDDLATTHAPGALSAAFAFDLDPGLALPIAVVGEGPSVVSLRRLGAWAITVPQAVRELGSSPTFALAGTATGEVVALWCQGHILCLVVCADRTHLAAVAAKRLAAA